MLDFLYGLPIWLLALFCSLFTYGVTALGAATVFFFKKVNKRILNTMIGFAAGVMIAASFWSLLSPSIELSSALGYIKWLYPAIGFIFGGVFVVIAGVMLEKFSRKDDLGLKNKHNRSFLLVLSITLHNIPEGLSVGVAFGAFASGVPGAEIIGALLLAMGIGLQNFPEGASVSIPLRRDGMSRGKAFFYGQASGIVEPLACMLGFFLASAVRSLLPFALAFSAGAMIAVVAAELLPESNENKNFSTIGCIAGFVLMMILDVALG